MCVSCVCVRGGMCVCVCHVCVLGGDVCVRHILSMYERANLNLLRVCVCVCVFLHAVEKSRERG